VEWAGKKGEGGRKNGDCLDTVFGLKVALGLSAAKLSPAISADNVHLSDV